MADDAVPAGLGTAADAFVHCADLVRSQDPDRATAILFAAPERRGALHALTAFDIETAAIRDRVRQPIAGEIRLQWWRDTIAGTGEGEGSPVASALLRTIRTHDLPREAFERLLEARIFDLYDDPMPSREAFETYAGETLSTIITLGAMILDRAAAPKVAGLAGHAGVALLAGSTLRDETLHSARGQVFVPADLLAASGLDRDGWLAGGEAAEPARAALAALAREHLAKVEAGWRRIPQAVRPAFLPVRLALSSRGSLAPLSRSWRFWRAMRAGEAPV